MRTRALAAAQHSGEIVLRTGRFAAVGDLQRTSLAEVWRQSNDREREGVIRSIVGDGPDFVVLLGDLVFRGSSAAEWARFDALAAPLGEARIPVVPILGNHEYWVARRPALANFFARFPNLAGRHYLLSTVTAEGLSFEMKGMDKGGSSFESLDRFLLPWPDAGARR